MERFDAAARDYAVKNLRMVKVWGMMGPMIQLVSGISYMIVLGYGGLQVINARISLGEFIAFNSYLGMLIWPMMAVGRVINVLQRGSASMDRLNVLFNEEPEVRDDPAIVKPVESLKGEIEFRNLSFAYPDGTHRPSRILTLSWRQENPGDYRQDWQRQDYFGQFASAHV